MRIYTSFFLFIAICSVNLSGQEVLFQLGAERSENWDAISCWEDNACFFAMGFREYTEVNGSRYNAIDRDVLLGRIENEQSIILGQLASAANTQISFLETDSSGLYLGGNAFSYLTYRGDTLFNEQGVNRAFILKLSFEGEYMFISTLDAKASAICVDGWACGVGIIGLFEVNDTVSIEAHQFIPEADAAGFIVLWNDQLELDTAFMLDGTGDIQPMALKGSSEALYIAGNFRGSIEFGPDSIFTRTADDDGFLAKWDRSIQQPEFVNHLSGVYQDNVRSLAVTEEQIIVGGQFIGAISFEELQIITGLSVAGFVGAFDLNGDALWLKGFFGNNDLLSVEHIERKGSQILFSVLMGEELYFENDTLSLPWTLGKIHSVTGILNTDGSLRRWNALEGDPIVLVSALIPREEKIEIALAFTGQFDGFPSNGGYDLLWLQDQFSNLNAVLPKPLITYPNPADESIYFQKQFSPTPYFMYNSMGQMLRTGILSGNRLDIRDLPEGAYVLIIEGDVRYVTRFVHLR